MFYRTWKTDNQSQTDKSTIHELNNLNMNVYKTRFHPSTLMPADRLRATPDCRATIQLHTPAPRPLGRGGDGRIQPGDPSAQSHNGKTTSPSAIGRGYGYSRGRTTVASRTSTNGFKHAPDADLRVRSPATYALSPPIKAPAVGDLATKLGDLHPGRPNREALSAREQKRKRGVITRTSCRAGR